MGVSRTLLFRDQRRSFFFYKKVLFGEIEATDEEAPEDWESNDMDEAECCVEAVLDLLDVEVIDVE